MQRRRFRELLGLSFGAQLAGGRGLPANPGGGAAATQFAFSIHSFFAQQHSQQFPESEVETQSSSPTRTEAQKKSQAPR
jgi:hypothetical protein